MKSFFKKALILGLTVGVVFGFLFTSINYANADRSFSLPDQTGQAGKVLGTDGTNPLWVSGGGSGTVTSITANGGLTASPNPIVGTGTISLDLTSNNTFTGQQIFNSTAATGVTNLETTLYADQFTGADICAKVNAAYAALPSMGGQIVIPAGSFSCATQISFSTLNKRVLLQGQPGNATTVTYTGTTGALITINNGAASVGSGVSSVGSGVYNLNIAGSTTANPTTGILLGGTNGAQSITISGVRFTSLGLGLNTTSNTWVTEVVNSYFESNAQNVLLNTSSNSGENMKFTDDTFVGLNSGITSCVQFATSAVASADFVNASFDDCQLDIAAGNEAVTITGGHMENPGQASNPGYDFMHIENGGSNFTNVTVTGMNFYNDSSSTVTPEFILNGGNLNMFGVTATRNTGGTVITSFVKNVTSFGSASIDGFRSANGPVTDIMNGVAPTAPTNGFFDHVVSKINSFPFAINQTSNNNTADFWNGANIVGTVDNNGYWELGNQSVEGSTAWLTLRPGSTTVAPLIIPSGTLNTTTQAGAIESDGTHLYFTPTAAGTRYQLDQQASAVTSVSNSDSTLTISPTTGAVVASLNLSQPNTWLANVTAPDFISSAGVTGFAFQSNSTATSSNLAVIAQGFGVTNSSTLLFGGASSIDFRDFVNGSSGGSLTTNASYGAFVIGSTPLTTSATGTNALLANFVVNPIGTVTAGGATVTTSSSLYVNGAGSGATTNYALDVASGISNFGGTIASSQSGGNTMIETGGGATSSDFTSITTGMSSATTNSLLLFAGGSNIHYRMAMSGTTAAAPSTGNPYASFIIGGMSASIPATGTTSLFAQQVINPLVISSLGGTLTNSASLYVNGASTGATNNYSIDVASGTSLFGGAVLSNGGGGIGYTTGAGGTITQATSKTTGVTLNAYSGTITMNNAALSSATIASFTVTDSDMGANDVISIQHDSGGTLGVYTVDPSTSASGSFVVNVRNDGTAPLSEAIVLRFAIIKGSTN